MKTVKFDQMGLYTLASLYVDCLSKNGAYHSKEEEKLGESIIHYVLMVRNDDYSEWRKKIDQIKALRAS